MPAAERADGPPRLLCFGRLLSYKGPDLLAGALASLPPDLAIEVRIVGSGPESRALKALRTCRGVTVENRWVPESQIGSLLAWSDALILPYREASQSGVVAAALAAGRPVIATSVGGLQEQLSGAPQAVLCEPDVDSVARAIRLWLATPIQMMPRANAAEAWRAAVTGLLLAIGSALPPRAGPRRLGSAGVGVPCDGLPLPPAGAMLGRQ
jgi:glycosyltransferase involved in cell wall biosynthesis